MSLLPRWYIHQPTPTGDDRWYYPADSIPTDKPLTSPHGQVELDAERRLLVADHPLQHVTWPGRPVQTTTGYELADHDTASARFPAALTPEQHAALHETHGDLVWDLYRPVVEEHPGDDQQHDFTGYQQLVDGGLDQHPEVRWDIGYGTRIWGDQFAHLQGGQIPAVWDTLAAALTGLPTVAAVHTSFGRFEVVLLIEWTTPWTEAREQIGARGQVLKRPALIEHTHQRKKLTFKPPHAIRAANKAAAVRELHEVLADLTEQIGSYQLRACTTCKGHGYIEPTRA